MTRKSITLAEVAKAAQVSPMTASRAINNRSGVSSQTRQHVIRIAAELGYVINRAAQKLSGGRSHIIGVIATGLETEFTGSLLAAISDAAWQAGYETLVYFHVDREKRPSGGVMQMLRQISDGVISVLPLEFGYLGEIASINIPVITVDHRGERAEFPSIASDCYGGTRRAIRHLIDLGHRRIAYIAGDERLASARDRHHAYVDTVAQYGLDNDPGLIVGGDFTQNRGSSAMQELLALDLPPTAVFCANDLTAFGAVAAIREAGLRIPEDISVIGFDDIPTAAQFYPPLTTVRQPLRQIGSSAVNALLALIAGIASASPQISLPTDLVVRSSTAPVKASIR